MLNLNLYKPLYRSDAPALLSNFAGESVGQISSHEVNDVLQDISSCVINSYGNWKPILKGSDVNTESDHHYWIQVDFPDTMKIVKIERQIDRDETDGSAWIQYGPDANNLEMYNDGGAIKVSSIKKK